ncbi:MAG: hypothetical protein WCB96_13005 [Candidatus Aminicenantales bacterium]
MKKTILLAALLCFGFGSLWAQAEQSQSVVNSFQPVVKQVDELFSTSPAVLITEDFQKPGLFILQSSKTGKINYLLKFEKIEISFDVQKTDSLISPFTAYIALKVKASSNADSGDIASVLGRGSMGWGKLRHWGFEGSDKALQATVFHSCCDAKRDDPTQCFGQVKILYAYQDGYWVFKGANDDPITRIPDEITARHLIEQISSNPDWAKYILPKK